MNITKKKKNINNLQIGYVILSSILNRNDYINQVIRINKVTILTNDGTVQNNCPILNGYNEKYIFPENIGELGSRVLLANVMGADVPVIIGLVSSTSFDDNIKNQNEFENQAIYESKECVININKDPKNGELNFNIIGKKDNKSNININAMSINNDSKINISVRGEANINSTEKINLNSEKEVNINIQDINQKDKKYSKIRFVNGIGFTLEDEFDNKIITKNDGTIIETKKIRIGKDETMKKILDDLFAAIKVMSFKHPQGPTLPKPINWKQFDSILKRINKFMEI